MTDQLEPLSNLAREVLDAERQRADESDAARDRVLTRIAATAALGAGAAAAGAVAGAAAASQIGTSAKAGAAVGAGWTATKIAPVVVAAFVAGGGAGAAIHAGVVASRPPPAVASLPSASAPIVPPLTSMVPTVASSAPPPSSAPSASPPPATARASSSSPRSDPALSEERGLIERARMALARGQSGDALTAVNEHARRFPGGRLVQEREALAIQALARSGRTGEAQSRARRFRSRYPKSVFLPTINAVAPASSSAP